MAHDKLKFIKKHKNEVLIAVGILCAVILVFASGCEKKEEEIISDTTAKYEEQIEAKLTKILADIDGIGSVKVMVTAECGREYVYAQNEESGEKELKSSYYTTGEKQPLLIKEIDPKIRGVAVVCDGGDDIVIQSKIIRLVSGVLKISTNRIFVGS